MSIEESFFGNMPDGQPVNKYTLRNASGMTIVVTQLGCRFLKIFVPDRNGKLGDVVLGYDDIKNYPANHHGSVAGRFANRIANGKFTLDGKTYSLYINNGRNTLHGGKVGFNQKIWKVKAQKSGDEPSISFEYLSPDGEEGYPGNLDVTITYKLTSDNTIKITYEADTDKKTPLNLTNHSFFNLNGDFNKSVLNHVLWIDADNITATTDDLIPTGKLTPVKGTPFDFTTPKEVGKDIKADDPFLNNVGGYDNNYVLNGNGYRKIAEAYEPESGRVMDVFTDLPGVQLFTDNGKGDGIPMKDGAMPFGYQALCLETQYFPDSPNHPEFPSCIVEPGKKWKSETAYKFSVK